MIEVDASYGEGGGQLLRTAVALSALTGNAVELANVRAKRARPGLAAQHLAAVRAVASVCDARCEGLELRSTSLRFSPGMQPPGGALRVDVGTAGSVTLVLQALVPVLLSARAPTRVLVTGGTDVRQAPTWDYFSCVLLRLLARMGLRVRASVARRGYYPRGGGEIAVEVEPAMPQPLVLGKPQAPWQIAGEAQVANLPLTIAERMRSAAQATLGREARIEARVLERGAAIGTGGAITLWAQSEATVLGASRVAERGVRAADQILVYAAMAKGGSSFAARAIQPCAHGDVAHPEIPAGALLSRGEGQPRAHPRRARSARALVDQRPRFARSRLARPHGIVGIAALEGDRRADQRLQLPPPFFAVGQPHRQRLLAVAYRPELQLDVDRAVAAAEVVQQPEARDPVIVRGPPGEHFVKSHPGPNRGA